MKRIVALLLAICISYSLCACSTSTQKEPSGLATYTDEIRTPMGSESQGELTWLTTTTNEYPFDKGCEARFIAVSDNTVFVAGVKGSTPMLTSFHTDYTSESSDNYHLMLPHHINIDSSELDEQYVYGMDTGNDGDLFLLMGELPDIYTFVDEKHEMRTNEEYQGLYSVLRFHSDGSKIGKISFQLPPNNDVLGAKCLYGLVCGNEGNLIVWGSSEVTLINWEKGLVNRVAMEPNSVDAVSKINGEIVVLSGINSQGKCQIVNIETGDLTTIADGNNVATSISSCQSFSGRLLLNDWSFLYEYEPYAGTLTELFNWTECGGLEGGSIKQVIELSNNFFLISYWHNDAITLIQRNCIYDTRQVLKLACYPGISRTMAKLVGEFNSSNSTYRVEYTNYDEDHLNLLLAQIASSNPPDILLSNGTIDTSSEGYSDLYPLLDHSELLSRSSFIPGLLNALSSKEELHEIWTSFTFNTFLARSEDLLNSSRTIESFETIAAQKGNNYSVFEKWVTRDELLKWIASISTGQYIDRAMGTCNFSVSSFSRLLEWCKRLPSLPQNTDDYQNALLYPQYIENPAVIENWTKMLGGNIEYVGFPVEGGNKNYLSCGFMSTLSIPSSGNITGAWDFIEFSLITIGRENIGADSMSMKFSTLNDPFRNAMYRSLGETDATKFINAVEETSTIITQSDEVLRRIIMDSCVGYFAGDKTLEDTVNLIQSRSSIYINEKLG